MVTYSYYPFSVVQTIFFLRPIFLMILCKSNYVNNKAIKKKGFPEEALLFYCHFSMMAIFAILPQQQKKCQPQGVPQQRFRAHMVMQRFPGLMPLE